MYIVISHLVLACLLFFIVNWLGENSKSFGYKKIDFFIEKESSVAFNFSFKVLSPTVFIIIISSIFYKIQMDDYTKNIYLISVYYVAIRLFVNLCIFDRLHIIDKKQYMLHSLFICLTSYYAYSYLIQPKKPLIPDFNTLSNELWIIIIIFIFNIINKIEIPESIKEEKLKKYIIIKYSEVRNSFSQVIESSCTKKFNSLKLSKITNYKKFIEVNIKFFKLLTYSIIIMEDFNRPKKLRKIENILVKISKNQRTLGIMQVSTKEVISDKESIKQGVEKIINKFHQEILNIDTEEFSVCPYTIFSNIIHDYNPSYEYEEQIGNILKILSYKEYQSDIFDLWVEQIRELDLKNGGE